MYTSGNTSEDLFLYSSTKSGCHYEFWGVSRSNCIHVYQMSIQNNKIQNGHTVWSESTLNVFTF